MQRIGLTALAETYHLGQGELARLRPLVRRFFDHFRDEIGVLTGAAPRIGAIRDRAEVSGGAADITAGDYVVALALDGAPALMLTSGPALAAAILDVALGGEPQVRQDSTRPLTPTEARVLAATMGQAAVAAAERTFEAAVSSSPRFVAIASGQGSVIAASLEKINPMPAMWARCTLGPATDELALAVPPAIFATPHITAVPHVARSRHSVNDKDRARARLGNTQLELRAVLGQREMTFSEVRALRPGAIVVLGSLNGAAPHVSLCCGDQILFDASAVAHRGWKRVLIQQTGIESGQSGNQ